MRTIANMKCNAINEPMGWQVIDSICKMSFFALCNFIMLVKSVVNDFRTYGPSEVFTIASHQLQLSCSPGTVSPLLRSNITSESWIFNFYFCILLFRRLLQSSIDTVEVRPDDQKARTSSWVRGGRRSRGRIRAQLPPHTCLQFETFMYLSINTLRTVEVLRVALNCLL